MMAARLSRRVLEDAGQTFDALFLMPAKPRSVVLFAVGAGGDPDRHLPLLRSIASQDCTVTAPKFERLASAAPSADELATRARRLQLTFDEVTQPSLPAAGVGHSIGAALLLMLAGAEASTFARDTVRVPPERRLTKLALMAPATDFFRAPGSLRGVVASIVTWVGTMDEITPPQAAQLLKVALQEVAPVDVRIVADAGHFSFMNAPPPHATEYLAHRDVFLEHLATDIANFITS